MCAISNPTSGKLRIAQGFIALSSLPGSCSAPRCVSVARMGRYEIRIFNSLPTRTDHAPVLWIELFDHDAQISVDGCVCREIDDVVSAFDDLVSQVKCSSGVCRPEVDDAQG
jgi:hypothetical protein